MNIEKRRAEIAARKAEIRKLIEGDSENKLNMDDLEKELRELNEEDEKLEKRQAIERMLNGGAAPASPAGLSNPVARSANQPAPESTEKLYRSAWLKTLQGKPLTDDEKRAYSTAANSGLPIIPETTANQIIKKMYEVAPILQRCKIFHVPGNFKFAIEGTNDEAALHTENAAITAASDSLGSVSLTGYEIVKLVKASRACSEMALSAFESYIVEVIAEAVARRIEKYIFTGTGTNQPGGVKTAGKGASGAYTDGTDQITVGKTASLTEENVIALYGLLGDGYERNAVWCMDDGCIISESKEKLEICLRELRRLCAEHGIRLNPKKTQIIKLTRGFTFVKVRFRYGANGKVVRRATYKGIRHMRKKLRIFRRWVDSGRMTAADVETSLVSWRGHMKRFHSYHMEQSVERLYRELFKGG